WEPLVLATDDDLPRSLAAYRLADVAVVNPVRDGMNLVAKEIPVACDDGCALVLSREAGAADELGDDALMVNPFDIVGTAEALHAALSMSDEERRRRTANLVQAATACPPARWLREQLGALDAAPADAGRRAPSAARANGHRGPPRSRRRTTSTECGQPAGQGPTCVPAGQGPTCVPRRTTSGLASTSARSAANLSSRRPFSTRMWSVKTFSTRM